jgi:TolB protein
LTVVLPAVPAVGDPVSESPLQTPWTAPTRTDLGQGPNSVPADLIDDPDCVFSSTDSGRPAWSPDGRKLAFISDRDVVGPGPSQCSWYVQFDVFSIDVDGSRRTNLTKTPEGHDFGPSWSPDGRAITFYSFMPTGTEADVFIVDAAGGAPLRLTGNYPGIDSDPAWSPDGTKIAFASDRAAADSSAQGCTVPDSGCPFDIFVMNADGTDVTNLTRSPSVDEEHPAWSPDGTKLAFVDWEGIKVMNADGSDPILIGPPSLRGREPAWSPDGTKIAFTSDSEGGYSDVVVMNIDGTDIRNLTTTSPQGDWGPAWSPDGTRIAFASGRNQDVDIFITSLDGTDVRNVTDG